MNRRRAFTLIELLIVLLIIGILAALLFPVFKRVQENGVQANCASNMHIIGMAVQQYYQDEKRYPASLAFLLPNTVQLNNPSGVSTDPACDTAAGTCPNTNGGDYLKLGEKIPMCPDDDNTTGPPRSSYGDVSTSVTTAITPAVPSADASRQVWNYWGYDEKGVAFKSPQDAAAAITANDSMRILLLNPPAAGTFNATNWTNPIYSGAGGNYRTNPIKNSMSNRFAPTNTVITHCIYHRLPTSNIDAPENMYATANDTNRSGAVDIVLMLDGRAKTIQSGSLTTPTTGAAAWQQQAF